MALHRTWIACVLEGLQLLLSVLLFGTLRRLQGFMSRTPLVMRSVLVVYGVLTIIGWVTQIGSLFASIPYYNVFYFQVYRMILSPFFEGQLLSFAFGIMAMITQGPQLEGKHGSIGVSILFLSFAASINVALTVFALVGSTIFGSSILMISSQGVWPIMLAFLSIDCATNPDAPRPILCLPVRVPSKFIPFILVGLMALLSGGLPFDLIFGVLLGFAYQFGYLDRIKPGFEQLRQLEEGRLAPIVQHQGYVSVDAAESGQGFTAQAGEWSNEQADSQDQAGRAQGRGAAGAATLGSLGGASAPPAGGAQAGRDPEANNPFKGKAHTAGSAGSSSSSSAGGAKSKASRAEQAAKRAAAVEARLAQQGNAGASADGRVPLGSSADHDADTTRNGESASALDSTVDGESLSTLISMGYDEAKARTALANSNGDIGMAAAILTEAEDEA